MVAIAQPKYDVALSFLATDEPTAAALCDRLREGLEVFFYPRKQEVLADKCVVQFMDLAARDQRGEVERPSW
ncbi:MAG: hypothetical protein NTY38_07685 [Acidobacteria bacterium]|nr:hypothetical protein [Acidobacteriota bacterium]